MWLPKKERENVQRTMSHCLNEGQFGNKIINNSNRLKLMKWNKKPWVHKIEIKKGMNWKCHEEKDRYRVSKYLPTQYLLITKGKTITYSVGRHHLTQEIKMNHNNGIDLNNVPPDRTQWELSTAPLAFLPMMQSFNRIMRKYQPNPHRGTFYKIIGLKS